MKFLDIDQDPISEEKQSVQDIFDYQLIILSQIQDKRYFPEANVALKYSKIQSLCEQNCKEKRNVISEFEISSLQWFKVMESLKNFFPIPCHKFKQYKIKLLDLSKVEIF